MGRPARKVEIEPRILTAEQAAAYCALPVATFKRLRLGEIHLGATVLYDRRALDAELDAKAGLTPRPRLSALAANQDDDPEAAFERSAPRF